MTTRDRIVEFLAARLDEQEADGRSLDYLQTGEFLLADAAAKRAIIDHMTKRRERVQFTTSDLTVLCILASAYADRPGYDESWRP